MLPAANVRGVVGRPVMLKSALPVSVTFLTVTATFATQVTIFDALDVFRFAVPKSIGDVQLRGKRTGEPNP